MKYCFNCGAQLPASATNFCPSCGANLRLLETQPQNATSPENKPESPPTTPDNRENTTPLAPAYRGAYDFIKGLKWRNWISVFMTFLIITIITISIGASTSMAAEDSSNILNNFKSQIPEPTASLIFANNLKIAFLMMIPVVGLLIGPYSMYSTGAIFSAASTSANIPGLWIFLFTLLMPFAWLEFFAYSAAMTQGIFLMAGLVKHRLRTEIIRTGLVAALIFILLLIGAVVESAIIQIK